MTTPRHHRKATLHSIVALVLLTALYAPALRWPSFAAMLHQAVR